MNNSELKGATWRKRVAGATAVVAIAIGAISATLPGSNAGAATGWGVKAPVAAPAETRSPDTETISDVSAQAIPQDTAKSTGWG